MKPVAHTASPMSLTFGKRQNQKESAQQQKLVKTFLQDYCGKIIEKLLNHLAIIILHIHKGEWPALAKRNRPPLRHVLQRKQMAVFGSSWFSPARRQMQKTKKRLSVSRSQA
jgi:hypothetical protein